MAWRITYTDAAAVAGDPSLKIGNLITEGLKIQSAGKVELRDNSGQTVRLGKDGEFSIEESLLGKRPEYYGESVIINKGFSCGKYRTSCWMVPLMPEETADMLIRPVPGESADEYQLFRGSIAITEFDESGRSYGIAFVSEGEKLVLGYDDEKRGRDRYYIISTGTLSKDDYSYFVNNYRDDHKWIVQ